MLIRKALKNIVIGTFLLFVSGVAHAEAPLILNAAVQHLGSAVSVLYDESSNLSEENVQHETFLKNASQTVELHGTQGNYWLSFSLKNNSNLVQERILSFEYAHIRELVLYEVKHNTLVQIGITSAAHPNNERNIFSRFPVLRLTLPAQSETRYFLKVHLGHIPLDYDIRLYPVDSFYKTQTESTIFFGLLTGFLLALLIYNLSLFFSLRLAQYFYFSAILVMVILIILGYEGYLYLMSDSVSVDLVSGYLRRIGALLGLVFIQYLQNTFELKRYLPRLVPYSNGLKIILVFLFMVSFPFIEVSVITDMLLLLLLLTALVVSMHIYRLGNKAALFIAIGVLFSLIGNASELLVLNTQDSIVEISSLEFTLVEWLRQYFLYLSIIIFYFFLSLALAVFVRQVRDERDVAQQASLDAFAESNSLKDNYAHQLELDIETATEELRQQAQQLKQLDQIKSRFFTNISHEFRTPLTLIKGPVMGLAGGDYGELNDKGKAAMDICARNIDRLSRLIDELLLLAEIESGSTRLKASFADINQFCRRTAALFTHTAAEKNIRFVQNIPSMELFLFFDLPKLEKVFCNLLSNAFKYTPRGGEVIFTVAAATAEEKSTGSFIDIRVEDTGQGIAEGEREQIFDRFYRTGKADDSVVEGSGIGLALVKELVTLHGGDIHVRARTDAQGGTGSCFTVSLPLGLAHLLEHEIQENQQPAAPRSQPQRDGISKTLLIVEDNPDMRAFVASLFAQDYRVIEAGHGQRALERLAEQPVDLVISDVMMPEMDGIQLLETIRKDEKWQLLPVLLLTAKATDEDRIQGLRARADEYLAKPFNAEELKLKVENLLRRTTAQVAMATDSNLSPPGSVAISEQSSKFLSRARETVLKYLANAEFDVQALAEAMHMSRSTLQRRMEEEAAMTAAHFIRQIRLEHAHQYIKNNTYRTLAETAYAVGFSHPGYFSRLYKKFAAELN